MKVLVLYYSAFGYVTIMANAVAEGAREAGAEVDIKRIDQTLLPPSEPESYFKSDHGVPVAVVDELVNYNAIVVGSPTRFGRLSSQVAGFLDQAGELGKSGALAGKVGGAFTSPSSQHGGQETAAMSILVNLLHYGMVVVGPPYSATTMVDATGQRHPSSVDLDGARQLGKSVALTAQNLFA